MVVPCTVKSRLKTCGETTVLPATASCQRITPASSPAIRKNARPATTYMTPRRLWSTVTIHSCARVSMSVRAVAQSGAAIVGASTLIAVVASAKRHEVGDELVQLVAGHLHRGHERAGLERGGIAHPGAKTLAAVGRHPRAERGAAHEMGEVGAEHAVRGGPADGVAVDARQRGEDLTPPGGRGNAGG